MKVVKTIDEVRSIIKEWKMKGYKIGFVPTMGYLHEGHESLIKKSVSENDKTVVSVFVNPIQFGPKEDLSTYPRDLNKDMALCEKAHADFIFNPDVDEMYKEGFTTYVSMNNIITNLCGKTRPTHFSGVCTVVSKLFNIVTPDNAYFGQKDAQQLSVIKRMVKDLNINVNVVGCPIIREEDGLAKSSRNTYLNKEERKAALILSKSLKLGMEAINNGERNAKKIVEIIKNNINTEKLAKIDYVEAVDLLSCENVNEIKGEVLVAIAVYIGKTRLIDNFIVEV